MIRESEVRIQKVRKVQKVQTENRRSEVRKTECKMRKIHIVVRE